MNRLSKETLRSLGAGETIDAVCRAARISREEFLARWKAAAASRVPATSGSVKASVGRRVEIDRDKWGVPHVYAESDADLYFGFGYAMAQDRLFQLDWLRRKGAGRLAEILGQDGLELDVVARTVGLNRIARTLCERLPDETRRLLDAFSAGVNALVEANGDDLPIEFDLLDYRPDPWQPLDCLLIETEFAWYLTGRFPVIAIPELARRHLGDGALYRAFLTGEADDESILASGDYQTSSPGIEPVGEAIGDPDSAVGSNNWVVSGRRTASGKPTVASDPHIAFEAVSCWYEVHLQGGALDVAGCAYVGMPAILIGRNRRLAWGITNNICSIRDLYQEQTSPEHPGCFLFDGGWQPARELTELIHVRGFGPVSKRIVFSHNGPLVDPILPPPANETGPVSLKWLGAYQGGWLTALLGINRAKDATSFREALRPWHVPTFSVVYADVNGNIGYQATGRIPLRKHWERGYRPGWDREHQWQGLIPFEGMPATLNPSRGFIATANNRVAANDFPYPLAGTWTSGERCRRIREQITSQDILRRDNHRDLHQDARSLRAEACLPCLCAALSGDQDERVRRVATLLEEWNGDYLPELVAPTVFGVFFVEWCQRVAAERFPENAAPLLVGGIEGLAAELLWQHDRWKRPVGLPVQSVEAAEFEHIVLCPLLGKVVVLLQEEETQLAIDDARRQSASRFPGWEPQVLTQKQLDLQLDKSVRAFSQIRNMPLGSEENLVAQGCFTFDELASLRPEDLVALCRLDHRRSMELIAFADHEADRLNEERRKSRIWFVDADRNTLIRATFRGTLDRLASRFGNEITQWTWGRLHCLDLKHVLSARGSLGELLNHGGTGVRGDATTVCNTGRGPDFEAATGAGYRMICDLGESPPGLWAVDCQSQSGHPGSPHYADQFGEWLKGEYHFIPLDRPAAVSDGISTLRLEPASS